MAHHHDDDGEDDDDDRKWLLKTRLKVTTKNAPAAHVDDADGTIVN